MYGLNLKSTPFVGSKTLIQRALSILKRPGIEAHVYLPGIGTLSGLQAANYLDSVGTTLGTVDQPVGLVLDAAGGLGVELVTNGTFDSASGWSTGTNTVISGGVATTSGATAFAQVVSQSIAVTQGKTYLFSVTASKVSGNSLALGLGAQNIILGMNGSATYSSYVSVTGASGALLLNVFEGNGVTWVGSIDNISVREVTGIAATQPTTAAKPILRQTAGKYSWAFDGNDSLALGSVPFQMSDDHAVIAAITPTAVANQGSVCVASSSSSFSKLAALSFNNSSGHYAKWTADGPTDYQTTPSFTYAGGATYVSSARKIAASGVHRVNGVQRGAITISGSATLNAGYIGLEGNGGGYFTGSTGPILAIKGTLTDNEMLTLERFVAQLTPNAPVF